MPRRTLPGTNRCGASAIGVAVLVRDFAVLATTIGGATRRRALRASKRSARKAASKEVGSSPPWLLRLASQGDDFDVVVVGAGVSGLTAAHRCARWGDDMALPTLRKPVSISRPKRGRHGVFAGLGEDEPSLEEFKPSLFSEASTWSQASWTSALSSQPRNMGPFDPEETADMELAPRGWARQIRPVDHRTTDVKRLRPDEAELAEAKRALRGVRPGDWNSEAFAHYKKKLTKEGRWLALPGLVDMVRRTSDEALKAGGYCLPKNKTAQVRLPQKPSVQWVSMESCTEPDPCQGVVPPPLVVSHKTPLEAAGVLGKHFEGHPLIVTFEATEFDTGAESEMKKGQILEGEARGLAQHEMFNCTNLVFSSRAATLLCAKARQSPQERLNAWHDPGVIVADNVVLFRGPAEDGYPFLSQEEQLNLRVLVAGRALKRLGPR
ncbi:Hypothetical protein SCF082_LOCUS44021 [Durusdinium trenchii]|uniref:FAD-dependent oxidoreductase 2 FAD-binding domain-containing protein n=1 Tax=Durusdinium trenchii TaxID=1381693 RepID=A0ABP0R2J0_9DINO